MKTLFLSLLLTAGIANADTITLGNTTGLGNLHQYHGVVNDVGIQIDIYGPNGSTNLHTIYVYFAGDYANPFSGVYANGQPIALADATGHTETMTIFETSVSLLCGKYRCTHWTLQSGSIVR